MKQKGIIPDSLFITGVVNICLYLVIYTLGCFLSGWSCSGDQMGGLMMVYSLTLYVPQLLFFIFVSFYLLSRLACVFKRDENERPARGDWMKSLLYFSLALVAVFAGEYR